MTMRRLSDEQLYNNGSPRLGPLLCCTTRFPVFAAFKQDLTGSCNL